jgi:glucokinase
MIVLAGDIGGTNARLALLELEAGSARVLRANTHPSRNYPALAPIVQEFLAGGPRPERACYGIAGPVVDQKVRATNLAWMLDAQEIARDTGIAHTWLINDFSAVAYGIARLGSQDFATLQEAAPQPQGPIGLIGAGTGLGHGFLLWDAGSYRVHASEAGHMAFAPRNELEWGLARFLIAEFGRASVERVVSGPGLAHVYAYLAQARYAPEQPSVRDEMQVEDPAAVVTRHALAGTDALCDKALELFVSAYGAAAGHLALMVVATGGVYIAGGIAPRIVRRMQDGAFMRAFRGLGRFADFAATIPVRVIVNPDVGLLGAAAAAFGWPTSASRAAPP